MTKTGAGRPAELGEARSARLELRLHDVERDAIERAALDAGLATGEWSRAILLTAAGSTALLSQLHRVERSPEERLESFRHRRLAEIAAGRKTPFHTARSTEHRGSLKRMKFPKGVTLHLAPRLISLPSSVMRENGVDVVKQARLIDQEFTPRLFPHHGAEDAHGTTVIEDGYVRAGAILFIPHLSGLVTPIGYSYLQGGDTLETVLVEHVSSSRIEPRLVADLRQIVAGQLIALREIGAVPPLVLGLSLFGVGDVEVPVRRDLGRAHTPRRLVGDEHFLPLVTIPSWDADLRELLRGPLDALWRIAGHEACPYVDDDAAKSRR
jgi:hypothetical protein